MDFPFAATDEVFGPALREVREAAGLSQDELAVRMSAEGFGFSQATIYKIENRKRKVGLGEALALAAILRVPVERLAIPERNTAAAVREAIKGQARHSLTVIGESSDSVLTVIGDLRALRDLLDEYVSRVGTHPAFAARTEDPWKAYHSLMEFEHGARGYVTEIQALVADPLVRDLMSELGVDEHAVTRLAWA
ncbi:helix-turn-helix transcriptional regulator [Agromyces sp. NPDC055658]